MQDICAYRPHVLFVNVDALAIQPATLIGIAGENLPERVVMISASDSQLEIFEHSKITFSQADDLIPLLRML